MRNNHKLFHINNLRNMTTSRSCHEKLKNMTTHTGEAPGRTHVPAISRTIKAMLLLLVSLCSASSVLSADPVTMQPLAKIPGAKPRNIVLIVADDHRHDALGCAGHPFLKTPHLDALARGGARLPNAFVTTSLCSPSRASILTGLYTHRHHVVDNNNPVPPGLTFFPQYLQAAGYQTAFLGKWHMGSDSDAPQPGYDHWVSFKGQGTYWPNPNGLNINGRHVAQNGYITDELTDYAVQWLDARSGDKPFLLHLAHKAVHTDLLPDENRQSKLLVPGVEGQIGFIPAPRHTGRYANEAFTPPESMAFTPRNFADKPMWVQNRRNSRHGVDVPFGNKVDIPTIYRQYMETLLAVDDSVGRILDAIRRKNILDSTLIIYMGDNGYAWGEHGMVDKRAAYEESMRIPLIVHCPEVIKTAVQVPQMVANIDIAPTILEAAGLVPPASLDGRSFFPLVQGRSIPWRDKLLYEYYWEWNFPMTPTIHAIRTDRYKFIRPYGLWDVEELYDLERDPHEIVNIAGDPNHEHVAKELKEQMFQILKDTAGMSIPLFEDRDAQSNRRLPGATPQALFPAQLMQK
jgi:N-acetylglucosamine-6-sulfatase